MGFSANHVSYLSVLIALLATVLMMTGSYPLSIAGAALFNLWAVLDCIDGNIARVRCQASKYGGFVDALGGYVAFAVVLLGAGVAAEKAGAYVPGSLNSVDFTLLGAIASISNLTMRLVYQHFMNVSRERIMGPGTWQRSLASNLGITGLLMPAVLAGILWGFLHWIVFFYAVFYASTFVIVIVRLVRRVERLGRQA